MRGYLWWRAFFKAALLLALLGRPVPKDLEEAFPLS